MPLRFNIPLFSLTLSPEYQDRPPSAMRVSHDPRGRYLDEDEDEVAEEDAGRRSSSPESPREPTVIGPWLKMAVDFAGKGDADAGLGDIVEVR